MESIGRILVKIVYRSKSLQNLEFELEKNLGVKNGWLSAQYEILLICIIAIFSELG